MQVLAGLNLSCQKEAIIICDPTVARLHLEAVIGLFADASSLVVDITEKTKTRETKALIEDALLARGCGRDICLVALGGGVICDVVAFVASTYCRGVDLLLLPTTLLAMVDAAIGGKTGVNVGPYKNRIGTFYPAQATYIDERFLATLPEAELAQGKAELIKTALVWDMSLLQGENAIFRTALAKLAICQQDPNEQGLRRILNWGHTIGHAIEAASNYEIPHGTAVASGCYVEALLSHRLGLLQDIEAALAHLPCRQLLAEPSQILPFLSLDKKAAKRQARFVLLEKPGVCHPCEGQYCCAVPDKILQEVLHDAYHHIAYS